MDKKMMAKKEALKKIKKEAAKKDGKGLEELLSGRAVAAKVIAKDKDSLKEGLKKAAEVVDESDEIEEAVHEAMESEDHEMEEDHEMDDDMDLESMSKEELIEYIKSM